MKTTVKKTNVQIILIEPKDTESVSLKRLSPDKLFIIGQKHNRDIIHLPNFVQSTIPNYFALNVSITTDLIVKSCTKFLPFKCLY